MPKKNPGEKTSIPGVYKIGPKRYRVRAKYIDPRTGRTKELDQIVKAQRPDQAAAKREQLKQEKLAAGDAPATRLRLGDYATSWLDAKRPELEISTAERYLEALDLHILPHIGDVYLDRLTRADVLTWRNGLLSTGHHRPAKDEDGNEAPRGLSPVTINGHLRVLRVVLEDGVREGLLARNVASDVRPLPEPKRTEATSNRLTSEELGAVLAHLRASEPAWHAYFLTAALTGARFGEVSALRWEDIDHERGVIHVRRAVKKGRDPKTKAWIRRIGPTKTGEEREVAMPPELASALRDHRRGLVENQAPGVDKGWCFPSPKAGELLWSSALRKPLLRSLEAAGVARRVTLHGLRRTFTNLVSQNPAVRPEVVRSLTGHKLEEMRQHYTFAEREEKRAAVAGLVALLGEGGGPGGDPDPGDETTG